MPSIAPMAEQQQQQQQQEQEAGVQLLIVGLHHDATEEDLWQAFEAPGGLVAAYLAAVRVRPKPAPAPEAMWCLGYALLTLESRRHAQRALSQVHQVGGRALRPLGEGGGVCMRGARTQPRIHALA